MKYYLLPVFLVCCRLGFCQDPHQDFYAQLNTTTVIPSDVSSVRSVVLYAHTFSGKELVDVQESFQQSGIDAVAYFELDFALSGKDVGSALSYYLNKRGIQYLVLLTKTPESYQMYITRYNEKASLVDASQSAWHASDKELSQLLLRLYRATGSLKRGNLLINSFPETELKIDIIAGRRSDFFAIDLKVDPAAVPKFGDEERDRALAQAFEIYPLKYNLTEPNLTERELRVKGNHYVLCYIHTRGSIARELLGYDTSKENSYVSVAYPDGQPVLKTLAPDDFVYKFYFKHIESGNVFLGTKWDADPSWEQALKNHLMAFKHELKL